MFQILLQSEVIESQFSYPENPSDEQARLAAGQVYYWGVVGLDNTGNITSQSAYPYSFSMAEGGGTSKDLAILSIAQSMLPAPDPSQTMVEIAVKNQGSRSESNVTVSVTAAGVQQGKQSMDSINSLEEKNLTFAVYLPEKRTGPGFVVTATFDQWLDDNSSNNTLGTQLPWPEVVVAPEGQIHGTVLLGNTGNNKAGNSLVTYTGPKNGNVEANQGGEYHIRDLPFGNYVLKARYNNVDSAPRNVSVTNSDKVKNNEDLRVILSAAAAASETKQVSSGLSEASKAAFAKAAFSAITPQIKEELKGYKLDSIDAPDLSAQEVADILEGIAKGTVKIVGMSMQ